MPSFSLCSISLLRATPKSNLKQSNREAEQQICKIYIYSESVDKHNNKVKNKDIGRARKLIEKTSIWKTAPTKPRCPPVNAKIVLQEIQATSVRFFGDVFAKLTTLALGIEGREPSLNTPNPKIQTQNKSYQVLFHAMLALCCAAGTEFEGSSNFCGLRVRGWIEDGAHAGLGRLRVSCYTSSAETL